jgi:radical SAM-linked protein
MRFRYRIRFRKVGDLRFIGHQDLARLWERIFRRAGLPLAMSEGFHPKARLSFPLSLPLGMEADEEVFEVQLLESIDADVLRQSINAQCPPGLEATQVDALPPQAPKAQVVRASYEAVVPSEHCAAVAQKLHQLMQQPHWPCVREDGRQVDIRPDIEVLTFQEGKLFFTLRHHHQAGARPRDVLAILGLDMASQPQLLVRRTRVELIDAGAVPEPVVESGKDQHPS